MPIWSPKQPRERGTMTMWMVRAESDGRLFQWFVAQSVVAIGWSDVGDLTAFGSRDEILAEVQRQYPEHSLGWRRSSAGMLFRFSRDIEPGHHVITYDPMRRVYAVGTINADYEHRPDLCEEYPQVRHVDSG